MTNYAFSIFPDDNTLKSIPSKKDNFKPDGGFKLGENKPTRKMNHNQFNAFIEGIDFKVLSSGKIEKA